jgi:hypothetical protein
LRLDGELVSDRADADPGKFSGEAVEVVLGELDASRDRSFEFQVRIN